MNIAHEVSHSSEPADKAAARGEGVARKEPTGDKTLFEIYRDAAGTFRVVYFTELDAHERDHEIERAMSAAHVFDGFLRAGDRNAKACVTELVGRLNAGEHLDCGTIGRALGPFLE